MMSMSIKEKNLHLVEKRDVLSYTREEFNAMDEDRQMETLWLQMDACLEEIKEEEKETEPPVVSSNPPREIDIDAALQRTLEWLNTPKWISTSVHHC
jgi:hypothetical protein